MGAILALLLGAAGAAGTYFRARTSESYPHQWDLRVAAIVQFVEGERGLKFRHPVAVAFLPDTQFNAKVGADQAPSAKDKADLQHAAGELRALGLIHGEADIAAMGKELALQSVVGLYVPKDKRVYVRGSQVTPEVRVTLAHELTHALQDQHVDVEKLLHLPNADPSAVRALVEGDAVRVQTAYAATMSAADRATYEQTSAGQASAVDAKGISQVLIDEASFPYIFGPVLVKALVASGGTAAVDHALANPPTVDAQVADPNRYLIQTDVATVAAPKLGAGDTRLSPPSPFGQVSMLEVVGAGAGYQAAWSSLESWRGDEAIDYLHRGQACIAIASSFDSAEHAANFEAVAQRWAAGRDASSTVSMAGTASAGGTANAGGSGSASAGGTASPASKTVELRSCDPGPDAPAATAVSPRPFQVLSLRSSLIGDLIDNAKAPADVAACVADQVILTVGPAPLLVLAAPGAPTGVVARAVAEAAKICGLAAPS